METAYNMVIGSSLVVLLALVVGMCVAGAWRHLTRQLTRGGLVVFLTGAGIATVEAQKTIYVDINAQPGSGAFKTIQDAFDYLDGKKVTMWILLWLPAYIRPLTSRISTLGARRF